MLQCSTYVLGIRWWFEEIIVGLELSLFKRMGTTSLKFMNYVFYALVVPQKRALRKKCPYSELFWSVFSLIPTECREIRSIFSYSV